MQLLFRGQFPEVACVVRHEREIIRENAGHQVPISLAAKTKPVDMKAVVAVFLRHSHERGVQAFIDKEFQEAAPEDFQESTLASGKRFTDFTFNPCSDSFFGRPLAG